MTDKTILGRYAILCVVGRFGIVVGSAQAIIFGYSIGFYAVGAPLLVFAYIALVLCYILLYKHLRRYAKIYITVVESLFFVATTVCSIVFTPTTVLWQNGEIIGWHSEFTTLQALGFIVLYIATLCIGAGRDRKICTEYLRLRKEDKHKKRH